MGLLFTYLFVIGCQSYAYYSIILLSFTTFPILTTAKLKTVRSKYNNKNIKKKKEKIFAFIDKHLGHTNIYPEIKIGQNVSEKLDFSQASIALFSSF